MSDSVVSSEVHVTEKMKDLLSKAYTCLGCGKCSGGCPMVYLLPEHYNPHKILEKIVEDPTEAHLTKDIWFCASCYKCSKKCPQGIDLPGTFLELRRLSYKKENSQILKEAISQLNTKVPFFNSFFRVCYHPEWIPVEKEGLNEFLKVSLTTESMTEIDKSLGKVAIIGSGPAGLYAAFKLRQKGYMVNVYESREYAGGMFSSAIPEFRVKNENVSSDIDTIKGLGIKITTNTTIGEDIQFSDFRDYGYEAIFIATGAHRSMNLNIEGEQLPQVMKSLDFLEAFNEVKLTQKIEKLVVIGGGNTAMDVALSAVKLGAKEVTVLYRRTKEEMPAGADEIKEIEEQGVKINYLVSPVKFIGDTSLTGVECIEMELGYPDLSGRRRPVPIEGSNTVIEADFAVVAIGEKPALDYLPDKIKVNKNGTVAINPLTMETSMNGVFAGGDVVFGAATVAEAIMAAGKAAESIDKYMGELKGSGLEIV